MLVARAELNYYPEEKVEVKKRKISSKKKKSYVLEKTLFMFIATMLLLIGLFILIGYANITATRLEITKLEKYKVELEKNKMDLIADLEEIKSSARISEDAMYKLGMDYPSSDQIVYISINEETYENDEHISTAEKLKKVLSIFSSLF